MINTVSNIINSNLIVLDRGFTDKAQALDYLSHLLFENGAVIDREVYIQAVLERENLGTTFIGHGIAIPHGKSEAVIKTAVAFARIPLGVNYDDQGVAQMIFMIAAPSESDNDHLKVLSLLARKLMHENNRQLLMDATTAEDIIRVFDGEVS